MCSHFLVASRAVAKKNGTPTDRGCAVFDHGGGWYEVRDYSDNIVWADKAHCRYCARAEAISKMAADSDQHKTGCYVAAGQAPSELASDEICGGCGQPAASGHAFNCQRWVRP